MGSPAAGLVRLAELGYSGGSVRVQVARGPLFDPVDIMTKANSRSQLVVDTRVVGRQAGSSHEVERTVALANPLGTELVAVPAGGDVQLSVRLEAVVEGILVSGSASADAHGTCVRCLGPVTVPVSVGFRELFAYPERAVHHREVAPEEEADDVRPIVDGTIDLEPVLRDEIVPALPFQPVCRTDCPGLCDQCGASLADEPDHRHETLDPRWAALSGLRTGGQPAANERN